MAQKHYSSPPVTPHFLEFSNHAQTFKDENKFSWIQQTIEVVKIIILQSLKLINKHKN